MKSVFESVPTEILPVLKYVESLNLKGPGIRSI